MKRILNLVITLLILFNAVSIPASADGLDSLLNRREYNGLYYNKSTGYIVDAISKTEFEIPEEIDGVSIVGIATGAFALSYDLIRIFIPDSVVEIADDAFGQFHPTIGCNPGSYAEKWAKDHKFMVESASGKYTISMPENQTIRVGETTTIKATVMNGDKMVTDAEGVIWQNTESSVVKMEELSGYYEILVEVKGLKAGTSTITAIYKNIRASCKVTVTDDRERGFDMTRDGWPIINARQAFHYSKNYSIPDERWIEVYGDAVRPFLEAMTDDERKWGGNCYGMCATAYLYYMGQLNTHMNELNTDGYEMTNKGDFFWWFASEYPSLNSDSELCKQIERYSIAQECYSTEMLAILNRFYETEESLQYKNMFKKVINILQSSRHPLALGIQWLKNDTRETAGHELLTDSSREVEDQGNGWYKIYLYDPNNPHYDNDDNLKLPGCYDEWNNRFINVNVNTGEWNMKVGSNSDGKAYDVSMPAGQSVDTESYTYLYFMDFDGTPNNFDTKLTMKPSNSNESNMSISCTDITITNSLGKEVFVIDNGKIKNKDDSIMVIKGKTDAIGEQNRSNNYKIVLPDTDYSAKVENSGRVSVFSGNELSSATLNQGEITVDFTDNDMRINATDNSNITVVQAETKSSSRYNSKVINGELEKGKYINIDDNFETETNSNNKFDVKELSDTGDKSYQSVDLNGDDNKDDKTSFGSEVSDWAKEEVEEAYKENLIPDVLVGDDLTEKIDRSEFAAIAVKMYEKLADTTVSAGSNPFKDIDNNASKADILKAYKLGITAGVSDTSFEPDTLINREQLATMLCRAIKKYSFDGWSLSRDSDYYLDTSGVPKFADDADISEFAKPSVYYMTKFGIIKGIDDTHFAPKNTTSAQEAIGYAMATKEQAIALSLRIFKMSDIWK